MEAKDKRHSKKSRTSLLKAQIGQSVVLQIQRTASPRHETITVHAYKPTDVVFCTDWKII